MFTHAANSIVPVLLCGGSGKRLYPLSTPEHPKHLRPFYPNGCSLFQMTLARARLVSDRILCVGSVAHEKQIVAQSEGYPVRILLESVPRNTAVSSLAAALFVAEENPQATLVLMPCDHVIGATDIWVQQIRSAIPFAATGHIILFGITPTHSTEYGYVVHAPLTIGDSPFYPVERFVEKPAIERLTPLIETGRSFLNSGIFVLSAQTLIEAMRSLRPDTYQAVRDAVEGLSSGLMTRARLDSTRLLDLPSEPIDRAVMEEAHSLVVAPARFDWRDVGSLEQLAQLCAQDVPIHQEIRQYFASRLVAAPA